MLDIKKGFWEGDENNGWYLYLKPYNKVYLMINHFWNGYAVYLRITDPYCGYKFTSFKDRRFMTRGEAFDFGLDNLQKEITFNANGGIDYGEINY